MLLDLEFGYGDNTIFTPAETANGRLVDFRKINLSLNLEFKSGSIFVKLYEDKQEVFILFNLFIASDIPKVNL